MATTGMATTGIGSVYDLRAEIEEKPFRAQNVAALRSKRKPLADAQVCTGEVFDLLSELNNPSRAEHRDDHIHQGLHMKRGARARPRFASALLGVAMLSATSAFPSTDKTALACKTYNMVAPFSFSSYNGYVFAFLGVAIV